MQEEVKFNATKYKSKLFRNISSFDNLYKILAGDLLNVILDNQLKRELREKGEEYIPVEDSFETFTLFSLREFVNKNNDEDKKRKIDLILFSLSESLFNVDNDLESMFKEIREQIKNSIILDNNKNLKNAYLGLKESFNNINFSELKFNITKDKFIGIEDMTEEDKVLMHFMSELAVFLDLKKFPNKNKLRDVITNRQGVDALIIKDKNITFVDNKMKITDSDRKKYFGESMFIELWADKTKNDKGWLAENKILADEIHNFGHFNTSYNGQESNYSKINYFYEKVKRISKLSGRVRFEEEEKIIKEFNDFINEYKTQKIDYKVSKFKVTELKKAIKINDIYKEKIEGLIKRLRDENLDQVNDSGISIRVIENPRYPVKEKLNGLVENAEKLKEMREASLLGKEIHLSGPYTKPFFIGYKTDNGYVLKEDIGILKSTYQTSLNGLNKGNKVSSCAYLTKDTLQKMMKDNIIKTEQEVIRGKHP